MGWGRPGPPHGSLLNFIVEPVKVWRSGSRFLFYMLRQKTHLLSSGTISSTSLPFTPLSMASIAQETVVGVRFVHLTWMTSSETHSVPLH